MKTYSRICLRTETFEDDERPGRQITLERGKEYTTSAVDVNDNVVVFSRYWFLAPASLFGGAIRTGGGSHD